MWLRSLKVRHYGCVRAAELSFARGLNVLFGPNDLGKSTLAHAIRSALLVPSTSSVMKDVSPWTVDETPEVILTFETEQERIWRVHKCFGGGAAGSKAHFERSRDGVVFELQAKGREVDGELRKLLGWGIHAPGGRKAPRGLPQAFLATVLLGEQGDVGSVLSQTLADDTDESGRKQLTAALAALAEDPQFKRILGEAQRKVDEAFTGTGRRKSGRSTPFALATAEVNEARQVYDRLREQQEKAEMLHQEVLRLSSAQQEKLGLQQTCEEQLKALRAQAEQAKQRAAVEGALAEARAKIEAQRKTLQELVASEQLLTALRERRAQLVTESQRAQQAQSAATARQGSAEQAKRSLDEQRSRSEHALKLLGEVLEATARRDDALAQQREGEQELEALKRRAQQAQDRAEVSARLDVAKRSRDHAVEVTEQLQQSETRLAELSSELEQAEGRSREAQRGHEQALAQLDAARDALRRAESDEASREVALQRSRVEQRLAEAKGEAERARSVSQRADKLAEHEAQLAELDTALSQQRLALQRHEADQREAQAAIEAAEDQLEQLEQLERLVERDRLQRELEELARKVEQADTDAEAAADARARADALKGELREGLPDHEALTSLRKLEREREQARARCGVGLAVRLRRASGVEAQAEVDGEVVQLGDAKATAELSGQRRIELSLADIAGAQLAQLEIEAGDADARRRARELDGRWRDEIEPLLERCGVTTVEQLAALLRDDRERREQLAKLLGEAAQLEQTAALKRPAPDELARRQDRSRELAEQLATVDLEALATRREQLDFPEAIATERQQLEDHRAEQRAAKEHAATAAQELNIELSKLETQRDAHREALDGAEGGPAAESWAASARELRDTAKAAAEAIGQIETELASLADGADRAHGEAKQALNQAELAEAEAKRLAAEAEARVTELGQQLAATRATVKHQREQAAKADLDATKADVDRLQAQLDELPEVGEIAAKELERATASVEQATQALTEAERQLSRAEGALEQVNVELVSPEAIASSEGDHRAAAHRALQAEVARLQRELAEATTEVEEASAELATAEAAAKSAAEQLVDIDGQIGRAETNLEHCRRAAEATDIEAAEAAQSELEAKLAELPTATPVSAEQLARASEQLEEATLALKHVEDELRKAQGAHERLGGTVIAERVEQAKEAFELAERKQREVDVDYDAYKLLVETLRAAENSEGQHLGRALAVPVGERLSELTNARYERVELDANLQTEGVVAAGVARDLERLSLGTNEQIATLLRLTIAERLKSSLLLDDQLTQTDPARCQHFGQLLRNHAVEGQIIVITCRPHDYLPQGELPGDGEEQRDSNAGVIRAINLAQRIERL